LHANDGLRQIVELYEQKLFKSIVDYELSPFDFYNMENILDMIEKQRHHKAHGKLIAQIIPTNKKIINPNDNLQDEKQNDS